MSSSEKLKRRKTRQVLRYHVPNKHLRPEKFAQYLLFMFYPFRDENPLKVNNSYCQKLDEEGVLHTINENKRFFDPDCEEINNAFVRLSQDYFTELNEEQPLPEGVGTSGYVNMSNVMISDDSMTEMIRSLNSQQKEIFDEVFNLYESKCKYRNSLTKKKVNSLNVFISGGAGVGKSYLINTIFQTVTTTFSLYSGTPEKFKVLKMAPTGVAAVNINGITINTALGIPTIGDNNNPKLGDKMWCKLRLMYSELEAVIIDEISEVSNIRLYQIHGRNICEKFSVSIDIPFAGLLFL